MKRIATHLLPVVLFFGCAHKNVDRSFDVLEHALKGVDVLVDTFAQRWHDAVKRRIAECAHTTTQQEARACLGKYAEGERYEKDAKLLADLYDTVAAELPNAREAAKRLEELVRDE